MIGLVREQFSNFKHQTIPVQAIRRVWTILAGYGEQPMRAIEAGITFISHFRGSENQMALTPLIPPFLVATLVDEQSIAEAEKLTPIVFAGAGTAGAALPEDSDILNWPSRTPIRSSLKEQGYGWQVLDVYKQESALLGFAPQVIQAWGSAWPLKPVEDSFVADFNRLTNTIPLDARMPIRTLPGIIYLKKKELLKPAWEGAQPTLYLLEPYRVLYVFK